MKKKVLIIDDDPKDFKLLSRWAKSMGFTTVLPKDHSRMTKAMGENVTDDYVFKQIRENYSNLVLILCDLKHHDNYNAGLVLVEKIRGFVIPQMKGWSLEVPIFCVTRYKSLLDDRYDPGAYGLIDKTRIEKVMNTVDFESDLNNPDNKNPYLEYERKWRDRILSRVGNFEKCVSDNAKKVNKQKVFIVHGHNEEVKEKVYNVLLRWKLDPVVLHEKANLGQAIIEKFESNSEDVGFAIILLTADDLGRLNEKDTGEKDNQPRARQNVIFEMGYFMAKLSRSRVFLLLEDGVEKPSDLGGIVYTPLKKGWENELSRELRACGYKKADANKL